MKRPAITSDTRSKKPDLRLESLDRGLARGGDAVALFREVLATGREAMTRDFESGTEVAELVRRRAGLVDGLLERAWQLHVREYRYSLALVAVGGYGRGELHPGSDIDVTVLLPDDQDAPWEEAVERFIAFLWDIGLEVGHSVRSVADCVRECEKDVTVTTTLMESRLLSGDEELFVRMREATGVQHVWLAPEFFRAKLEEQKTRHHRFHDTAYNLEPDIKESPGGLRDIQMIGWVAYRHFGADRLDDLVAHGFLTSSELDALLAGRAFLWKIRFALHTLTGRREDRLMFDHQVKLARMLGYEDASFTLAVEQMMQRYYRTVMELRRLNEMLLQLLEEAILLDTDSEPELLTEHFQEHNGFLEVSDEGVFERHPPALLELFLVLQQHPQLRGVSARTIRLVRRSRNLIGDEFRTSPRNHRLFQEILRAPEGVTRELRRMNRYGILGRYIPAFGRIVGRMQYDLFHAYTVDAHSLFVVGNLRRFALQRYDHEFPLCSRILQSLPKPELAYLAGLFHDIAKGRGGDHSELGAMEAEAFCLEQGYGRYDARLVAWLVRYHLTLSITSQKKDISDPNVINDFAGLVGDQLHLDYLYVLTVADVRGTNPKLWNSWKASLFEELYRQARRALQRGLENPIDSEELVDEKKREARTIMRSDGLPNAKIETVWERFTDEYFLRHSATEISWQTGLVAAAGPDAERRGEPLVGMEPESGRGGTAVCVYSPPEQHTFGQVTATLNELGLTIVDARIIPCTNGYSIDTYLLLERDGRPIVDAHRLAEIEAVLKRTLVGAATTPRVTRRAPRQVRMFTTPIEIEFRTDTDNQRTIMTLIAGDHPGLLSDVAEVFERHGVVVQTAKITTPGERAEDVFFVTDGDGNRLDEHIYGKLSDDVRKALGSDLSERRP